MAASQVPASHREIDTLAQNYLAIVNPAAGGGRSGKLLGPALERLAAGGIETDVVQTTRSPDRPPKSRARRTAAAFETSLRSAAMGLPTKS